MKKSLLVFISFFIVLALSVDAAKPKRSSKNVRSQKQKTEQKIKETSAQIEAKNREITRALNDLNLLNAEISEYNIEISRLNQQLARIGAQIQVVTDSINFLDSKLEEMRKSMSIALVEAHKSRRAMDNLAFIISSESFQQAYRRTQALKQFAKWRDRKAAEIAETMALLDQRRKHLDSLKAQSTLAVAQLDSQRRTLEQKQRATNELAAGLRKEQRHLQRVIKEQQAKADELERELERVLLAEQKEAEERARRQAEAQAAANAANGNNGNNTTNPATRQSSPEDIKLSGDFAANKGKLPSPLSGHSTIVKQFGRQQHPDLPHVTTDNSGIDMQGEPGATVRAVFDGTVAEVLNSANYHNIILLKHGNYITVYGGIGQLAVKKGDKISRGQAMGHLFIDPNENRSILHFEIRDASVPGKITPQNPTIWLR